MKHTTEQDHLDRTMHNLEEKGLNPTHSAMVQNIIRFRVLGAMEYLPSHKAEILQRIRLATPGMVADIETLFKNCGA